MNSQLIFVENADSKKRLDIYLSEELDFTRSKVANLVKDGHILVNDSKIKPGYIIKEKDTILLTLPDIISELEPQDIQIDIIFEDSDISVVNKQQGLAVHPGGGAVTNTLANALVFKYKGLPNLSGNDRPGIVHRLDKDTSGLMVIAKTEQAHVNLSKQFADRSVKKTYIAIVEGLPKLDTDEIKTFITRDFKNRKLMKVSTFEGREAITQYKVLERFSQNALVEFNILTGRTHQIRVHAKHIGHQIVGDKSYGFVKQRFNLKGQLLHAKTLEFTHPTTNKLVSFSVRPHEEFNRILELLRSQNIKD